MPAESRFSALTRVQTSDVCLRAAPQAAEIDELDDSAALLGERVDRREWSMMYVPRLNPSLRRGSLTLLAPTADVVPQWFESIDVDAAKHASYLAELQRLRGSAYLADGAISDAELSGDGRHVQDVDAASWHVLSTHGNDVAGCARFRSYQTNVSLERLGAWGSPLARDPAWAPWLRKALQGEIRAARQRRQLFVEVGGWAIGEEWRFGPDAIDIALSMFALARSMGGCIGITTATVRNHSARILRKLGGRPLLLDGCELPAYYDPRYRCEMEILRFDSTAPSPRYEAQIDRIAAGFASVPVVCAAPATAPVLAFRPRVPMLAPRMHEAYA